MPQHVSERTSSPDRGLGALLFKLVEQPFMRLRERLAPSNFAPAVSGTMQTAPSINNA